MIVYYAVGGGLGHLTRARRVLDALGLRDDARIVTASAYARDARVTAGIPIVEVPPQLEHDVAAHREWMAELEAERLLVDAFPGGIQGELCGLGAPMDLVARLLRWDEYRRAVPDPLPCFGTTYVIEELAPQQDAFVRAHSERVVGLDLADGRAAAPLAPRDAPYWLIVHSGPEDEVRELIAYTGELHPPSLVLVATQCDVPLPQGFERVDAYPASTLYPHAGRIITAAGFNVMLETEPWRDKHAVVPFPRRFDDQYLRAARRRP
jgi:hypothetical protein